MPCTRPSRVWRTKWAASPGGRPSSPPWVSGWTPRQAACQLLSSSQPPTRATGSSSAAAPSSPCWVSLSQGRATKGPDASRGGGVGGCGPCTHKDAGSRNWGGMSFLRDGTVPARLLPIWRKPWSDLSIRNGKASSAQQGSASSWGDMR